MGRQFLAMLMTQLFLLQGTLFMLLDDRTQRLIILLRHRFP